MAASDVVEKLDVVLPSVGSRCLGLAAAPEAAGSWLFVATPAVGAEVFLDSFCLWSDPKAVNAAIYTEVELWAGTGEPTSVSDVQKWEHVCPVFGAYGVAPNYLYGVQPIRMVDGMSFVTFLVGRLYGGLARRFAMTCRRVGAANQDHVVCLLNVREV